MIRIGNIAGIDQKHKDQEGIEDAVRAQYKGSLVIAKDVTTIVH